MERNLIIIIHSMTNAIAKFISGLYELIPGDLKIIVYPAFLTMLVSYLALAADDLREILLTASRYQIPLVVFTLTLVGGLIGYLLKKGAKQADVVLVENEDATTIQRLNNKVQDTKKILAGK